MTSYTIGLDDTDSGRAALEWVDQLSPGPKDIVKIVTVAEPLRTATNRRLTVAAESMRRSNPRTQVVEVVADGPVVARLTAEAADGDFLVVGAHRGHVLRSMMTGWRPERIAVASSVPTVVVPADWRRFDGDGDVVVGVNTAEESPAALVAARFADALGRSVILVSARAIARSSGSAATPRRSVSAGTALTVEHDVLVEVQHAVRDRYPHLDVRTTTTVGDPGDVLTAAAEEALLVVLGREHRTAARGALFGSVGMHLIQGSRTPLCVVPAP
jgi:nucleotide-binding universal stress UspA family protein